MTLTRQNETVATSETSETKYFWVTKTMQNQAVVEDFGSVLTQKNRVMPGKCINWGHCCGGGY